MRPMLVQEEIAKSGCASEKGRKKIPLIPVKDIDRVIGDEVKEFVSERGNGHNDRYKRAVGRRCLLPTQQSRFYKLFAPPSV